MNINTLVDEASKKTEFYEPSRWGAEEQEIIDLQSYYKITLLDDYKHFLKSFCFCAWFGDYICGLPEESFRFKKSLSVYNKTNYFIDFYKEHELQAVSKRGVIINKYDGGGYYFYFQKSRAVQVRSVYF